MNSPVLNFWEKYLVQIMAKIPDNVTLTLHQAKFPEKTLVVLKGECHSRIPVWMKKGEIHGF